MGSLRSFLDAKELQLLLGVQSDSGGKLNRLIFQVPQLETESASHDF
jgi:hypothetical protein